MNFSGIPEKFMTDDGKLRCPALACRVYKLVKYFLQKLTTMQVGRDVRVKVLKRGMVDENTRKTLLLQ